MLRTRNRRPVERRVSDLTQIVINSLTHVDSDGSDSESVGELPEVKVEIKEDLNHELHFDEGCSSDVKGDVDLSAECSGDVCVSECCAVDGTDAPSHLDHILSHLHDPDSDAPHHDAESAQYDVDNDEVERDEDTLVTEYEAKVHRRATSSRGDNMLQHVRFDKRSFARAVSWCTDRHYACNYCDFTARAKVDILAHMSCCHNKHYHVCNLCKRRFIARSEAVDHVHASHTYSCAHCSYTDYRSWRVKSHEAAEHNDKPLFKCDMCLFNTPTLWLLKQHVKRRHDSNQDIVNIVLSSMTPLT